MCSLETQNDIYIHLLPQPLEILTMMTVMSKRKTEKGKDVLLIWIKEQTRRVKKAVNNTDISTGGGGGGVGGGGERGTHKKERKHTSKEERI